MTFNLLKEEWITVKRRSGLIEDISPSQMTVRYEEDPVIELAFGRPDFNGAVIQFMIGLIQTILPPTSSLNHRNLFKTPPTQSYLESRFAKYSPAFETLGLATRFMQDYDSLEGIQASSIQRLFPEQPGESTINKNTDHYFHRGLIQSTCIRCAVIGLFSLQTNAPSGGGGSEGGHRTSVRGGGPTTTLVLGNSLWETVWLNVFERQFLKGNHEYTVGLTARVFPWLDSTQTSANDRAIAFHNEAPEHVYWAMPRRIRLIESINASGNLNTCDICQSRHPISVQEFRTTRHGGLYPSDQWCHPLSPYVKTKNLISPLHLKHSSMGYRAWLSIIASANSFIAPTNLHLLNEDQSRSEFASNVRLWIFGYEFDKEKVRSWIDQTMPLFVMDKSLQNIFNQFLSDLVLATELVANQLNKSVKKALLHRVNEKEKKENKFPDMRRPSSLFWAATESQFFQLASSTRKELCEGKIAFESEKELWIKILRGAAFEIFDSIVNSQDFSSSDPKRVSESYNYLRTFVHVNNVKLRDAIRLPHSGLSFPIKQRKITKAQTQEATQ